MAFILPFDDEKDKDQEAKVLSQESGDVSGVGAAPAPQGAPTSSGSFVNLQKYLNANIDQSPSSVIADKIRSQGQSARQGLQQSTQKFNEKADSGTANFNQELIDNALSDPTAFISDPNRVEEFKKQRENKYEGPDSLYDVEGYDPAGGYAANDAARQTQTEQGQFSLLQRYLGRPSYNKGEQNLDQLLLKNAPRSKQDFDSVNQEMGGLRQEFDSAEKAASEKSQQKRQNAKQSSEYIQEKLLGEAGAISVLNKSIDDRLTARTSQRDAEVEQLRAALANRNISALPEPLRQALGLNSNFGPLFGVDATQFLQPMNSSQLNRQSVSTADEQAKMAALAQLAGIENTMLPGSQLAGTADDERLVGYGQSTLRNAVDNAGREYYSRENSFNQQQQALQNLMNQKIAEYQSYSMLNGVDPLSSNAPDDWYAPLRDEIRALNQQKLDQNSQFENYRNSAGFYDRFR